MRINISEISTPKTTFSMTSIGVLFVPKSIIIPLYYLKQNYLTNSLHLFYQHPQHNTYNQHFLLSQQKIHLNFAQSC